MDVTSLVGPSWAKILGDEFDKPYIKDLMQFITSERSKYNVYPKQSNVFNALKLTPYNKVKVVIIGNEPYLYEGESHGLAYSYEKEPIKPSPTFTNIMNEIEDEFGFSVNQNHNLTYLAQQGVLLLNRIFTVREGLPHSHGGRGWEYFTNRILNELNERFTPTVFMIWGTVPFYSKIEFDEGFHKILKTSSPLPQTVNDGFKGCNHFWLANEFLIEHNLTPIEWIPT
jgi:uracil-DNA glycosylase